MATEKSYPIKAVWKNNDFDQEVIIVDCYGNFAGIIYYRAESGTGIPENQLEFPKEETFLEKASKFFDFLTK